MKEFLRRHLRIIYYTTGVVVLIIVLQWLYPSDRALPFAKVNGDGVGLQTRDDLAKRLGPVYNKASLTWQIDDKKPSMVFDKAGVKMDYGAMHVSAAKYAWWERMIPLSILVKGLFVNVPAKMSINKDVFALSSKDVEKLCHKDAVNASIAVKGDDVVLQPAKDGRQCTTESLKKQVLAAVTTKQGAQIKVGTRPLAPIRTDAQVRPLLSEAKATIARPLAILLPGKQHDVPKDVLASWLVFREDPTTKKLALGLDGEKPKEYIATIQQSIYIKPGTTVITTHDGVETARAPGASGRAVDAAGTIKRLEEKLFAGGGQVEAVITQLSPTIAYNRSYSKTPEGLQAMVNDLAKDKGDFAISVRKLGDSGVSANGDKQYHPASTYKLYVAYAVLKRIESGQMQWEQAALAGQTVNQCFDAMIVKSDNACAERLRDMIGWKEVNDMLKAIGLTGTNIHTKFLTTANDLALFLQKLESGQLVNETSRARLIDVMKRQIFRKGIPAGVSAPVADKVGFLDGLLHDAAIVYAPSGVYVLVVMSNGSSWGQIADVTRQIQEQMN